MNRDSITRSIWQEGVEAYKPVNNWNKSETYDILIVGGGITGLTAALLLQSEGKKCILAEAHNIGFGTTGGTTAHLNTILDTSYDVIEKNFSEDDAKLVASATRESIDLIEGLANKYEIDCDFAYKTGYLYAETEEQVAELEEIKKATCRAGIVAAWAEQLPLQVPYIKAMRVELQAQVHATKYLAGLARAYEQEGGVLLQQCIVDKVAHDEYHTASTSYGDIRAKRIVYATHIPPGINLLHFRNVPYRSYVVAFTLKSGPYPDGLMYDCQEPYHYFRTQKVNGKTYLIAGGADHKTGDEPNTERSFRELEAYVRSKFDVGDMDYKWSSQYFVPADGLPYIGLLPGHSNTYVGTGYSGNGMVLGSLAAKIICELVTNNKSRYEKLFDPARIKPVAGFADFVKQNADVVSKFIGMRFDYQKITSLVELAPGEAMLAEWEGSKVALYKDENGKVHALDPVCPHARCLVAWNTAEKSWDCPCHGSRFACNGSLLTGPARRGLTQIKWEDIEGD